MTQADPAHLRVAAAIGAWRREWCAKWGIPLPPPPEAPEEYIAWEARVPPEAQADFDRGFQELMAEFRRAPQGGPVAGQPLPAPRSHDEAMFYLDLHACERCGAGETRWTAGLAEVDGTMVRRYEGVCANCGQQREFVFQLDDVPARRPEGVRYWYGGDDPSRLLDAGQWLALYEHAIEAAREERVRGAVDEAASNAELAATFVAEAMKFLPPGSDQVPDSAFWSLVGRRLHEAEPERFSRRRLGHVLGMIREEFPGTGLPSATRPDAPPLGRTSAEIHLYLDMSPCECGETSFDRTSRVHEEAGELVARYEAACPRCGRPRRFAFRLPATPIGSGDEGPEFRYGDARPSELLDPGEWLAAADALARSVPMLDANADAAARDRFRSVLGRAAAAIDEVAKFAPPGAAEVPASAFRSERGRALYRAEPGRFRLDRLIAVSATYRRLLAEAGLDQGEVGQR